MKVGYIILAAVLVLVVALLPIVLVIFSPEVSANGSTSWLLNVKDMSVIYASMFMCVGALLFVVMTALLALIAFQIREHVVPALQKVDDTAKTVKGTATFVSESVVSPIIKVAGAAAGARAMVQTLVRRDAQEVPKKAKEIDKAKENNK